MDSKAVVFVVFAIVVQSSAEQDSSLLNQFVTIQSGGNGTLKSFLVVMDGYFDTMLWLAKQNSENGGYNERIISELESINEKLVINWLLTLRFTELGFKPVTVNASAFASDNIEKLLEEMIDMVFSPFREIIRRKSYSETLAAIEAIEKKAIAIVIGSTIDVYNIIQYAISAGELEVINAIKTIEPKVGRDFERAFTAVFTGFKILLLELYGRPQAQGQSFSSLIEIERNVAHVYLTDEAHTKFTLSYYTAVARYLEEITAVNYFNEIEIAELAVFNQFAGLSEYLYTTIIETSKNEGSKCTAEIIGGEIFLHLYAPILGGVIAFAATQMDGTPRYNLNQTAVYEELLIVAHGIADAIKLTQKSNTCGVRTGIRRIEKKVVATIVDVFRKSFDAIGDIAKRLGNDATAIIQGASRNALLAIGRAVTSIFHAIESILQSGTSNAVFEYCDDSASALKINRDITFTGFKEQVILKFDIIRIFNLYAYLKNYGINVPFSLLRIT